MMMMMMMMIIIIIIIIVVPFVEGALRNDLNSTVSV